MKVLDFMLSLLMKKEHNYDTNGNKRQNYTNEEQKALVSLFKLSNL